MLINITSKIINFFVISSILLLINSCAYFRLKELDKYTFSENDIYDLISKEYKDLTRIEFYYLFPYAFLTIALGVYPELITCFIYIA